MQCVEFHSNQGFLLKLVLGGEYLGGGTSLFYPFLHLIQCLGLQLRAPEPAYIALSEAMSFGPTWMAQSGT